jgi:hypothetical protein
MRITRNLKTLAFVLAAVLPASLVVAASPSLLHTFNDPNPTVVDAFGDNVDIDGNQLLIGAAGDDTDGTEVGQAYLYDAQSFSRLTTFHDNDGSSIDGFGGSGAVEDNTVVIGAFADDSAGAQVGEIQIFNTSGTWQVTKQDITPTTRDRYGWRNSVDLSNGTIVAGAIGHDAAGDPNIGEVQLTDAATGSFLWSATDPTPTTEDQFGFSAAMDDGKLIVGARLDDTNATNAGQAHLYDVSSGNLLRTFDSPSPATNDAFGQDVAIDDDYVLIGEPGHDTMTDPNTGQAYLFDATTGNLLATFENPAPTNAGAVNGFSNFAGDLALEVDGNHVVIGAIRDDNDGVDVGRAYLYDLQGNHLWTYKDPTPTGNDLFGRVSIDGELVLIGAPEDNTIANKTGQAHLFRVPEPATLAVVAVGGLLPMLRRRKRT